MSTLIFFFLLNSQPIFLSQELQKQLEKGFYNQILLLQRDKNCLLMFMTPKCVLGFLLIPQIPMSILRRGFSFLFRQIDSYYRQTLIRGRPSLQVDSYCNFYGISTFKSFSPSVCLKTSFNSCRAQVYHKMSQIKLKPKKFGPKECGPM